MKNEDIQLLFDFNYWATGQILSRAVKLDPDELTQATAFPWRSLLGTITHVLDSENVWRNLCQTGVFTGRLVDKVTFPDLNSVIDFWRGEETQMRAFITGLEDRDLDGIVRYQADGNVRERVLWHCLVHVVNHGTQHRSECAAMIKAFTGEPVALDMTRFLNVTGRG